MNAMAKRQVYLDHAAATPLRPEVKKAMEPYLGEEYGNPSSIHSLGVRAREAVERSRQRVADLLGVRPEEIIFTGSGTEANNLALLGFDGDGGLLTTPVEHASVLEPAQILKGWKVDVQTVQVSETGRVDLKDFAAKVGPGLTSVIYGNNEIGTIQDLPALAKIVHQAGGFIHTDACQAALALPIEVKVLKVDLMTLNAAKVGGPKGVGVLYRRKSVPLGPIIFGGGQERGLRSGTENVAGIVGLARALELARSEWQETGERLQRLRAILVERLRYAVPDLTINGDPEVVLPGIVSVTFPGVDGEALLLYLDKEEIQASAGSACEENAAERSHVLRGIGMKEQEIRSTIRFSLGRETSEVDIDYLLTVLPRVLPKVRLA